MRTYPLEARRHNMRRPAVPLSAEQMREFVARGFLVLRSSLPASYHRLIYERFDEASEDIGHFGNNLLPLIPELNEFFEDPVVRGALTSVVGPGYSMHPHRALHKNPPGSEEQAFHKDSYWGYTRRVRNHRPWWVMIMYFPQDTALEKGPTAVMEGSQHLNQRPEGICREVPIDGPAGSFVLIHYDIWHRKMLNRTDQRRYMFKFEFTRLVPPEVGSDLAVSWRRPRRRPTADLAPAWQATWNWLTGQPTSAVNGVPAGNGRPAANGRQAANGWPSAAELGSDDEAVGINAGYRLAAHAGAAALLDALDSNAEPHENRRRYSDDGQIWRQDAAVRNAAHGLVQLRRRALPGLVDVLGAGTARGRKHAAFALGEIGLPSAAAPLAGALGDDDVHVRIAAAEALGLLRPTAETRDALIGALDDAASEVRFDAALSLLRAAARGSLRLMAGAVAPLEGALYDTNRYVSAHAAEALERIGTPAALEALLPFLRTARWCPHTDNRRPF